MEVNDLVTKLRTENSDCDWVCQGDGSGTIWNRPCGYTCVGVEVKTDYSRIFVGGANVGTNNFAELSPYILSLAHYEKFIHRPTKPKVRIFSDSEVTVRCGNKEYVRSANLFLWRSIEYFEELFQIEWKWLPRESNVCLDGLSRIARKALEAI